MRTTSNMFATNIQPVGCLHPLSLFVVCPEELLTWVLAGEHPIILGLTNTATPSHPRYSAEVDPSLRRVIHKKNMLYNSYRKCKANWETYRKQRNLTTMIYKQSKAAYFRDGGPKKQAFWRTIKPFITDKNAFHIATNNFQEGDRIITDTQEIFEIFNAFLHPWLMI